MGTPKSGIPQAHSHGRLRINLEPYYLSKEDDDERIERLSKKIWECIQDSLRERNRGADDEDVKELLERDPDKILSS